MVPSVTIFTLPNRYLLLFTSQAALSRVWWWPTCGATCPCWTTGTWCPGWLWRAADTTAWCMMANCTPLGDWECRETWTTWRGKNHANLNTPCPRMTNRYYSSQLVTAEYQTALTLTFVPSWVWAVLHKYLNTKQHRYKRISIHPAQRNGADGVACSSVVQHIAKVVGQFC